MIGEGFDWKNPDYEIIYKQRNEALARMRDPNADFPALYQYYAENPDDFINDWGMTFDPRNVEIGLPAEIPFILFPKQRDFVNFVIDRWEERRDGLVEKSRDMGVTWLAVGIAVWMWIFKPGTVVGFGSRKEDLVEKAGDPNCIFWKIRAFIDWLPPEFKPKGYSENKHTSHMRITNPVNGSVIVGEAGDNIGRGGRTSIYFKDESAFYERPETIDAALSQTSNCKIDMSTVNGAGNPFYRKRHGGKIPVFVFDWRDDPRKDDAWYKRQEDSMTATALAAEVDRNYEAAVTNAYIPGPLVKAAMARGPADVGAFGKLRVGIDVARFGDDLTKIVFRRGRVHLNTITLDKHSVDQVAARARAEILAYRERPEQIAVDTIGIGAGVADILRGWFPDRFDHRTGKVVKVVQDVNSSLRMNDGLHYNMRAYMWAEMKAWLATASLINEQEMQVQLTSLRYGFRGGELLIESKEDAKKRGVKSPDEADALALTFAYPTLPDLDIPVPPVPPFEPLDEEIGY